MRWSALRSIRHVVPAVLALLALIITTTTGYLTWWTDTRLWRELQHRQVAALGNLVLPRIARSMSNEPAGGVAVELTNLAVAPDVVAAFLTNESDVIRFSTNSADTGIPLSRVRPPDALRLVADARTTGSTLIARSADGAVMRGAFPFPLALLPGEIRASRRGVLVLEMDLGGKERAAQLRIVQHSAVVGGIAALLCLGLWIYFRKGFWKRAQELVAAADAVGRGEKFVGFASTENDELAQIGRAFDRMNEELQVQLKRLRESEERFRSAMVNSAVGMAIVSPDGRYLDVNPALCAITGYTREEMISTGFPPITHHEDIAADQDRARALTEGAVPALVWTKRYVHKTGRIVWARVHTSMVRDASGRPLHFVSQIQDITAMRKADEDLRRQFTELQRWQQVTLHREGRVQELKAEVNALCAKLGQPPRYESQVRGTPGFEEGQDGRIAESAARSE